MTECRYYEMCALRASIRNLPRSCGARHCWMFRPMPDVDALLALAEELSSMRPFEVLDRRGAAEISRRIRESLGVES